MFLACAAWPCSVWRHIDAALLASQGVAPSRSVGDRRRARLLCIFAFLGLQQQGSHSPRDLRIPHITPLKSSRAKHPLLVVCVTTGPDSLLLPAKHTPAPPVYVPSPAPAQLPAAAAACLSLRRSLLRCLLLLRLCRSCLRRHVLHELLVDGVAAVLLHSRSHLQHQTSVCFMRVGPRPVKVERPSRWVLLMI